jgi:predicted nucleotidyltransferase
MTTPMWSYRVPPEQRSLLRRVADALKANPTLAPALEAALEGRAEPARTSIGAFKDEQAALGFIRDRLVFSLAPESIWLFGSRARRDHRPDSDFDILVVLPDELGAKAMDYRYVLEPVLGSGLPCDIIPCPFSDFEDAKEVRGTIVHEAFHRGRQLYQKRRQAPARAAA